MSQGYHSAVLGQFCAEVITYSALPYTTCSHKVIKEDIKQILTVFLVIFAGVASKLQKVGPTLSCFNPRPSLSYVATDNR